MNAFKPRCLKRGAARQLRNVTPFGRNERQNTVTIRFEQSDGGIYGKSPEPFII
jgi:hypothetical protein